MNVLLIIAEVQPKGWVVTVAGFLIVVITLTVLYFIFKEIAKVINFNWKKLIKKHKHDENSEKVRRGIALDVHEDIAVVIGLALSLSSEVHDKESDEITITRIQRRYSPWSSKIYGLNSLK